MNTQLYIDFWNDQENSPIAQINRKILTKEDPDRNGLGKELIAIIGLPNMERTDEISEAELTRDIRLKLLHFADIDGLTPQVTKQLRQWGQQINDLSDEEIDYFLEGGSYPETILYTDREKLVYLILSIGLASVDNKFSDHEIENVIQQAKNLGMNHDMIAVIRQFTKSVQKEIVMKNEIGEKNAEIQAQNEAISARAQRLSAQHKHIVDSINYASNIQRALLPSEEQLHLMVPKSFLINKAKDVVSGDFFWLTQSNDNVVIAVADCTGHGVPGAFMSILGTSLLSKVVDELEDSGVHVSPAAILEDLRHHIKVRLKQTDTQASSKDSMDIALINLKKDSNGNNFVSLSFEGAYNGVYIFRNSELIELAGKRCPVGIHLKERSFEDTHFDLLPGDRLYMFSDGFADQTNPQNKKIKKKRLRELLTTVQKLPLSEQKTTIEDYRNSWKGDSPQVDDMIMMGIEI